MEMLMIVPFQEEVERTVITVGGETFAAVVYPKKPTEKEKLMVYTSLMNSSFIEPYLVTHPSLIEEGFTLCYFDGEGQLNEKTSNPVASYFSGRAFFGRVLFIKEK